MSHLQGGVQTWPVLTLHLKPVPQWPRDICSKPNFDCYCNVLWSKSPLSFENKLGSNMRLVFQVHNFVHTFVGKHSCVKIFFISLTGNSGSYPVSCISEKVPISLSGPVWYKASTCPMSISSFHLLQLCLSLLFGMLAKHKPSENLQSMGIFYLQPD